MYVLAVTIGAIIGHISGFILAVYGHILLDRDSIEKGYIKLNGDYYKLTKISKENNDEN